MPPTKSGVKAKRPRTAPTPKPITLPVRSAADQLVMPYHSITKMLAREVFSTVRPQGQGRGKRVYLFADEVEVYATTRDEMAVRNLRAQKGRLPKGA